MRVYCGKCANVVEDPVRGFPELCRNCGREKILDAINLNPVQRGASLESSYEKPTGEGRSTWRMVGACLLAVVIFLAWVFGT